MYTSSKLKHCLLCCFDQNGSSNGELLIKNVQLKHAGQYTCTAQTPVDNITASAHLVVRGESRVTYVKCLKAFSKLNKHTMYSIYERQVFFFCYFT